MLITIIECKYGGYDGEGFGRLKAGKGVLLF
jgi:hypothetical protein